MLFSSSELQDAPASVSIYQSTVTFLNSVRNLVFYMDKNLSMKQYINFICKTAFFELRRISTSRQYLIVDATKTLVVSLVLSWIDYCNSLLASLPLSLISKLQRVQNCAARLVVRASLNVHTTPILTQLRWLPVQARISYKIACLCFSPINFSTPAYLSDILRLYSPARPLRSSADTRLLKLLLYKQKTKDDLAFSHFGPSVWNSLPPYIRNAATSILTSPLSKHISSTCISLTQ